MEIDPEEWLPAPVSLIRLLWGRSCHDKTLAAKDIPLRRLLMIDPEGHWLIQRWAWVTFGAVAGMPETGKYDSIYFVHLVGADPGLRRKIVRDTNPVAVLKEIMFGPQWKRRRVR